MKTVKIVLKVTAWTGLIINILSTSGFVMALHSMNSFGTNFAKGSSQSPWEATFSQIGYLFQNFMQSPFNFENKDTAFVFMSVLVYILTIVVVISLRNKKEVV